MIECIHILTSDSKLKVLEYLSKPTTPEDIAKSMGMTRQAIDKHMKDLVKYGIVERIWVMGSRKPRIEFKISSLGAFFYDTLKTFVRDYRELGIRDYEERLRMLDLKLVKDEIDMARHSEQREELELERNWFLTNEQDP